jgi:hypothetical protein
MVTISEDDARAILDSSRFDGTVREMAQPSKRAMDYFDAMVALAQAIKRNQSEGQQ